MNLNSIDLNKKIWINAIFSFVGFFIWILFIYKETFLGMTAIWERSETFTHGFLVPPIVIWLIWRKRAEFLIKQPKSNLFFLIPIIFLSFIWLLADLVSINSVTQLAATALVILSVFAVFGWSVTSVIIFPLLFLFFSVPLGEFLLPVLMAWTAKFTVIALRLSGVPVYQEGLQFVISSGSWSVVEACSGVRYLISSIMIGTLYAYLNYKSLNRRIIFICVSIVVPVLANWMRAYFIVMLGHYSNNTLAVGFDHLIYGWLFFGLVIMMMFLIGGRWAENTSTNDFPLSSILSNPIAKISRFWYVALIGAIFVTFPVAWVKLVANKNINDSLSLRAPAAFKSGWSTSSDQSAIIKPNFQGSALDVNTLYTKDKLQVGFFIKYYKNQNYENKLVSSDNSIFTAKDKFWIKLEEKNNFLNENGNSFTVLTSDWRGSKILDQPADIHMQIWQFYWVNGLFTANDYKAKLYGAVQQLLGRGDDAAIVVLYAKDFNSILASQSIEEFLRDNFLEIKEILERTAKH